MANSAIRVPNLDVPVPVSSGGTGQTTQTNAFDALSPTTTKGDLIVHNGTDNVRQSVGTNGQVLVADSSQTTGVKWDSGTSPWILEQTLTWTASTSDQTASGLTLADMYMVIIDFDISSGTGSTSVQLNGDTGSNYYFRTKEGSSLVSQTAQTSLGLLSSSLSPRRLTGSFIISGKHVSGFKTLSMNTAVNSVAGGGAGTIMIDGYQQSNSSNLSSVTFLISGNTVTGKAQFWRFDF